MFNGTDAEGVSAGADTTGEDAEITGLNLFLAVETDPSVIQSVQNRIAGDNRDEAKITSYYTTLDSNRIQQFDINCSRDESYMLLKEKIKGSAILNSDVYKYNWFDVNFWDHNRPLYDKREEEGYEVSGLSLDTERRYEWSAEGATALIYYTYAILQRSVVVKGIEILMS